MNEFRAIALNNCTHKNGQYIFTDIEMYKLANQIRDKLTQDILSWYNASKRAEQKDDPYWSGYQDAIDDVLESVFDHLQYDTL